MFSLLSSIKSWYAKSQVRMCKKLNHANWPEIEMIQFKAIKDVNATNGEEFVQF